MAVPRLNQKFKIPLQTEIQVYMKERKGWPASFILYYAERFWNFYQSNGWKVSGRAPMKDWKAAFNSQWQTLKFKEDVDMFQRCGGRQEPAKVFHIMTKKEQPEPQSDIERLDQLLAAYSKSPTSYSIEKFSQWKGLNECYAAIKVNRLWPPMDKKELPISEGEARVKAYIVVRTLNYYGTKGWVFSDTIKTRR